MNYEKRKQIFEESKIYSAYEYNQTDFENGFINGLTRTPPPFPIYCRISIQRKRLSDFFERGDTYI